MAVTSSKESPTSERRIQFENPPVVETALGIQFVELAEFKTVHFGLFALRLAPRYDSYSDQPRLPHLHEEFPRRITMPRLKLESIPRAERVWYQSSKDESRLLQLQPDRFGFNWRRAGAGPNYPSFTGNCPAFLEEFERLEAFVSDHSLGTVSPDLCEVVYVNHFFPDKLRDKDAMELFAKAFHRFSWEHSTEFLPTPDACSFNRVYMIGDQRGRLYAEASLAHHQDEGDFVVLKMTARVQLPKQARDGVWESLQLAHDWVVFGFESLTDATLRRERWGQLL